MSTLWVAKNLEIGMFTPAYIEVMSARELKGCGEDHKTDTGMG